MWRSIRSFAQSARAASSPSFGVGAQPVVEVDRVDGARAEHRHGDAGEQRRVGAAGEHHDPVGAASERTFESLALGKRRQASISRSLIAPSTDPSPMPGDHRCGCRRLQPSIEREATNSSTGSGKPFSSHLADRLEVQVLGAADRVDDRAGDQHLAGQCAGDDPVGEVDVAAVVVAVAVDGAAEVQARPRPRALAEQGQEAHGPLGHHAGVGRDDHHLVADRLDDRCLRRAASPRPSR